MIPPCGAVPIEFCDLVLIWLVSSAETNWSKTYNQVGINIRMILDTFCGILNAEELYEEGF